MAHSTPVVQSQPQEVQDVVALQLAARWPPPSARL
jgi:hypothetical protein